jgi:hypothetical protein
MINYIDLQIRLSEVKGKAHYHLQLTRDNRSVSGKFMLPFSIAELQETASRIGREVYRRRGILRSSSREYQELEKLGQNLFRSLFPPPDVFPFYEGVIRSTESEERQGVRHRLVIPPSLWYIPWEYLHDGRGFLSISIYTPIVRYIDAAQVIRPLQTRPPLRLLVLVAKPSDVPPLDVKKEKENIGLALRHESERISLTFLEGATYDKLRRVLLQARAHDEPFHIVHFIGHGGFDSSSRTGYLLFESEDGSQDPVTSERLWYLLRDHRSIRLAVVNACESASAVASFPFAGVATKLVQAGIPAVLAMQFPISDAAAIRFAGTFYHALSLGDPVDSAVGEGRKCLRGIPDAVEFGAPVLFMSTENGVIFGLPTTEAEHSDEVIQTNDIVKEKPKIDWPFLPEEKPPQSSLPAAGRMSGEIDSRPKPTERLPLTYGGQREWEPTETDRWLHRESPLPVRRSGEGSSTFTPLSGGDKPKSARNQDPTLNWSELKDLMSRGPTIAEPAPQPSREFCGVLRHLGCWWVLAIAAMIWLGVQAAELGYENYGMLGAISGFILVVLLAFIGFLVTIFLLWKFVTFFLLWKLWKILIGACVGAVFGVLVMFFLGKVESWSIFVLVGAIIGAIPVIVLLYIESEETSVS